MLAAALGAEATSFVAQFTAERLPDGRWRVVRHGNGPERMIQTGIGPIPVQRRKVRDRATGVPAERKIRFTSNILPRWARRSKSLDALLPVLYLRGISTGDFQEALTASLGTDAPNLAPGTIARLAAGWQEDCDRWQRRDTWRTASICRPGWRPQAECMMVILGRRPRAGRSCSASGSGCARARETLARAAGRAQGPWARRAAGTGCGRRRAGVPEGDGRGLPRNPSPALPVPQGRQRPQPFPEVHAARRHRRPARNLPRRDQGRRAGRPRCVRGL